MSWLPDRKHHRHQPRSALGHALYEVTEFGSPVRLDCTEKRVIKNQLERPATKFEGVADHYPAAHLFHARHQLISKVFGKVKRRHRPTRLGERQRIMAASASGNERSTISCPFQVGKTVHQLRVGASQIPRCGSIVVTGGPLLGFDELIHSQNLVPIEITILPNDFHRRNA